MLYNVSVNDGVFMYGNLCAYGSDNDGLMFVSAFGNSTVVQQAVRDLQTRKCTVRVHWSYYVVEAKSMEVISAKMQDSDYSHILMYKKDGQYGDLDRDWNGVECLRFYSYLEIPEGVNFGDIYNMARLKEYPQELVDSAYDKLLKLSPIPVIKEWVPYILSNATMSEHFKEANIYNSNDRQNFKCYYLDIPIIDLQRMLQSALRNKAIEIDGAETSDFMREIQGLDAYLSEFTVELTNKIQSSFVPRFIPGEDQYSIDLKSLSEYMNYSDDISLYPAQKDVAQAVSNTLDNNKCALVIAEMGSGIDEKLIA